MGSAAIGRHLSLLGLMRLANGVRSVGLAALEVAGALVGQPLEPVGTADDWAGVPMAPKIPTISVQMARSRRRCGRWNSESTGLVNTYIQWKRPAGCRGFHYV